MNSETKGAWGIDIGQAGLKAIRLKYAAAADQVLAVAFDYVPHPKILSQPDAIPDELISQALERFLSRNDVKGDYVAISVPGQTALTRFIQLPPVESSKVAEIVKYEARQQIPFALEDVCWQWQTLGGGTEESGYMLEAEVGLFAMKREQVMQHLKPFTDHQVEVDLVQIAPLGLYNYLSYDRLGIRPGSDVKPQDEHTIILDMGADNTTLMVSNGLKIWIRNVPIGGNHFTRALTKEMKLTFAKAEHLKLNATKAPDPRAVFQALRPVFNDYVSEIQRSIGYFSSVNRNAKIGKVIGLGNGFKLAGLQKFLQQNLQYEVERVDSFQSLVGDTVLNSKLFEENILSFAVPYGLALQALGQTRIHVDLLPQEIRTERLIRHKKPWAVLAAASILVGVALSATGYARNAKSVSMDRFGPAVGQAEDSTKFAADKKQVYDAEVAANTAQAEKDGQLVRTDRGRVEWLEMIKAVTVSQPRDPAGMFPDDAVKLKNRIKVYGIAATKVPDLAAWYKSMPESEKGFLATEDQNNPPTGEGYIVQLRVVHYHEETDAKGNPILGKTGVPWIREKFINNLKLWTVEHSAPLQTGKVPVREIGITHPMIKVSNLVERFDYVRDRRKLSKSPLNRNQGTSTEGGAPYYPMGSGRETPMTSAIGGSGGGGGTGNGAGTVRKVDDTKQEKNENVVDVPLSKFTIEFVWKPVPADKRYVFNALHSFFAQYPDRTPKRGENGKPVLDKDGKQETEPNPKWNLDEASKHAAVYLKPFEKAKGLQVTQELYDEFVKLHYHKAAPKTDTPAE